MKFDTKIAVVLRDDLQTWQKLNVTAFTISSIAGTVAGIMGQNYQDASDNIYLPMMVQPVLIFEATAAQIKTVYGRAMSRDLQFSIYTEELFATGNDEDNRAAVKAVPEAELKIVGMAFRAERSILDKVVKGLALHK